MDPISQAISTLRVGRGTVRRFRQSGAWGLRFSGLTGSGFHVVLHGTGWLLAADAPPVPLRAGDIVLVTSGADHGLAAEPRPLRGLPPVALGTARPPAGAAGFEFLCGAYRLDTGRVHPYLAALPGLLVVPAAATVSPPEAAAIDPYRPRDREPEAGYEPESGHEPGAARRPEAGLGPEAADGPEADRRPGSPLPSVVALLDAHEAQAGGPGTDTVRPALLDLMLTHALTGWLASADRPATPDPAITTLLNMIDDSPQTRWTVRDLGRAAGLSRAALTRRFTAAVGRPPMAYLIGARLDRAARLLRETEAPLSSIARQVGYATEFSFAGAFRREYGVAPGRFRAAARSGSSG
ncbi:AraC family transcriptional regulator [Catenuloplanes japonicus]|uniref:AraC family transcriptional regulator n=1 Tax=Catenuloplanes japonicus TaxID=33876 RepID=UPI0005250E1F|nr:AraC family transcriptional regulator [Catenuloplanes japonicus]